MSIKLQPKKKKPPDKNNGDSRAVTSFAIQLTTEIVEIWQSKECCIKIVIISEICTELDAKLQPIVLWC